MAALDFIDPEYLLRTFSYIGLGSVVFAETGLLLGFFLPGDTLLLTAGLYAARGDLNLYLVMLIVVLAAFVGNSAGYLIGRRFGPAVFARQRSRFFKPEYVVMAREYFEKHGNQTLVLSRFVPIVRTLVPTLAGTTGMNWRLFTIYNALGALLWGISIPLAGYLLGRVLPKEVLDKYILGVVGVIFVVSFIPVIVELTRRRMHARQARREAEKP